VQLSFKHKGTQQTADQSCSKFSGTAQVARENQTKPTGKCQSQYVIAKSFSFSSKQQQKNPKRINSLNELKQACMW